MIHPSNNSYVLGNLVRKEGLEPSRLTALEPKSSASTNSATFAPEYKLKTAAQAPAAGREVYQPATAKCAAARADFHDNQADTRPPCPTARCCRSC